MNGLRTAILVILVLALLACGAVGEGKKYKITVDSTVYYCNDYEEDSAGILWLYECGPLNNDHTFDNPEKVVVESNED